jgi:hypothetical protein
MKMVITPEGEIRHIYDDRLVGLAEHGESVTSRASHVEPTPDGKWEADMSPVDGPKLGPFGTRVEALKEEVKWLEENHIPAPMSCTSIETEV